MGYYDQPVVRGQPERDIATLVERMVGIMERYCQRIAKYGEASSKETLCLRRFDMAFPGSHSKVTPFIIS